MPIMVRGCVIKKLLFILIFPFVSLYSADINNQVKPVVYESDVSFRGCPWGTSMDEFIKKTGRPVSREEVDGLVSLVWESINVNGYTAFMVAYFSKSGLQGGTYYFLTYDLDEIKKCYSELRQELLDRHGPTVLYDIIHSARELRPYESSWHLPGGYVYLKVNTRTGDPVTLWYSSPELTRQLLGDRESVTAQR